MPLRHDDLRHVPIAAVMTRGPVTVEETAPLVDVAAEMAAGGFRHVPVVDADGRLVGVISERDLRSHLGTDAAGFAGAAADALSERVSEAMTPDPVALPPDATLADALTVFADDRVGAVPIVGSDDRVVGIVSYVDLLRTIRALSEERRAGPERGAESPSASR